jgi:DivIVA domain-containing protein
LTPADVAQLVFSKPPVGKRGYREEEADAFLDIVHAELAHLIQHNDDLRTRVDHVEQ